MMEVQELSQVVGAKRKTLTLSVATGDERSDHQLKTTKAFKRHKKAKQPRQINVEKLPFRFQEFLPADKAEHLRQTARWLVKPGVGILAADDTLQQIDAKLEEIKLYPSHINRYKFHELYLGGCLQLDEFLSGVLLREEAISRDVLRGKKLVHMIKRQHLKLGIRLDGGVIPLAGTDGEYTTCGLDSIESDCHRIKDFGAEFALWRCVYKISDFNPSRLAILENSHTLARFAVMCQKAGLLPIVSVDVLSHGSHNEVQARGCFKEILTGLVKAFSEHHVFLEGTLVRVTAAAPGTCYTGCHDPARVAKDTAETLNQCLPPALGGVLLARENILARSLEILNEIQNCPFQKPFFVSFCFSRVILNDVVSIWAGQDKNLDKAREELMNRLKCCSLATFGQCSRKPRTMFTEAEFLH